MFSSTLATVNNGQDDNFSGNFIQQGLDGEYTTGRENILVKIQN
jgi:hypothetical protein